MCSRLKGHAEGAARGRGQRTIHSSNNHYTNSSYSIMMISNRNNNHYTNSNYSIIIICSRNTNNNSNSNNSST